MRTLLLALLLLVPAGCSPFASGQAPSREGTELLIEVRPGGGSSPARRFTLRCDPAGGSLPNTDRACRRLASLLDPFRPLPRFVICTQEYGGPAVATVRGTFRGQPVDASFSRTNGCEIGRWDRVRFLFPVSLAKP